MPRKKQTARRGLVFWGGEGGGGRTADDEKGGEGAGAAVVFGAGGLGPVDPLGGHGCGGGGVLGEDLLGGGWMSWTQCVVVMAVGEKGERRAESWRMRNCWRDICDGLEKASLGPTLFVCRRHG